MRFETFWEKADEHMAIPFGDKTKQRKMRKHILRMNGTAFWPTAEGEQGVMISLLIGRPATNFNYRARALTAPHNDSDDERFFKTNVLHPVEYDNDTGIFVVRSVFVRLTEAEVSPEDEAQQIVDVRLDTRGTTSKLGGVVLFTAIETFVDLSKLPSLPPPIQAGPVGN